MSGQRRERAQEVENSWELWSFYFPPLQMWRKSESLALDSKVKSPIFWSIVQIAKGIRPQSQPEAA